MNSLNELMLPSAKNGFTRRSASTPSINDKSTAPAEFAVTIPYLIPLLFKTAETVRPLARAMAMVASRMPRRSEVISSASISLSPIPKRCGASRLSGLVATSPPEPAEPRGRPWQDEQLSATPAPIALLLPMSPAPSLGPEPRPCSVVNLR